jgi:hypothetical protein
MSSIEKVGMHGAPSDLVGFFCRCCSCIIDQSGGVKSSIRSQTCQPYERFHVAQLADSANENDLEALAGTLLSPMTGCSAAHDITWLSASSSGGSPLTLRHPQYRVPLRLVKKPVQQHHMNRDAVAGSLICSATISHNHSILAMPIRSTRYSSRTQCKEPTVRLPSSYLTSLLLSFFPSPPPRLLLLVSSSPRLLVSLLDPLLFPFL